jgi:tetratricopeptide (TPR) repeat protein
VLPLLCLIPPPPTPASPSNTTTVFERVNVIPMDRERVLTDYDVLVRDGCIVSVARHGTVPLPAPATRIDGTGRWLMPGLADMHVHLYDTEGFASYLAYGITTVANLNGEPANLRWRDRVKRGGLLGPTVYTAGPSINGNPPGNSGFTAVETTDQARAEVRRQWEMGYDFIKVYSTLPAPAYRAILSEAKARNMGVLGHVPIEVGLKAVLESGWQSNIAHAEEYLNGYFNHEKPDSSKIAEIARATRRGNMSVTANLFAYDDYLRTIADLPGVLADPEMRYASPALLAEKLPAHNRSVRDNPQAFVRYLRSGLDLFRQLTRELARAGVPILLGTDTEIFGFPGQSAHRELELLVDAGLTPYAALEAGTRRAGEYVKQHVHATEQFGTVTVGSRADLLLLEANPLGDVRRAEHPLGVMVRGRWLPRADLDRMRDSVAAHNAPLRDGVVRLDSLIRAGDAIAAEQLFQTLRTAHPHDRFLPYVVPENWADHLERRHPAAALAALRMNVELYPDHPSTHRRLGTTLLAAGDTAKGEHELRKAVELGPNDAETLDRLAMLEASRQPLALHLPDTLSLAIDVTDPGDPHIGRGRLVLARLGTEGGTLSTQRLAERPLRQLVGGGHRLWAFAEHDDQTIEARLQCQDGVVSGRFLGGWGQNFALSTGRPLRGC